MIIRRLFIPFVLTYFMLSAAWTPRANADMVLLGTAFKSFVIFPLVTVSLYVSDRNLKDNVLDDVPKRIEVHYHVNVSKKELDRQTIDGIKRNFSGNELIALMPKINQIDSYYPDIRAGDRICVTYMPGIGSQVQINGSIKGLVPGPDFAKAFFSIWVGKNPVDQKAKYKLLGQKD